MRVPTVDPWTGQPFVFAEQNLTMRDLNWTWGFRTQYQLREDGTAASVPSGLCVWCMGPRIDIEPSTDGRIAGGPTILDANLNRRLPTSMLDLLAAGQFFAIPDGAARPVRNAD